MIYTKEHLTGVLAGLLRAQAPEGTLRIIALILCIPWQDVLDLAFPERVIEAE